MRSDKFGYLRIELEEAATILSCSRRSVIRNLHTLSERGYISYTKGLYTGTYQVFLLSSTENKKTASQGGRGYFVLSYDMFKILLGCQTINELRLQLRGVISTLEGATKNQILHETSYADIKRMLPAYATKKLIRNTITSDHFCQMFGVKLSKERSFFYITMKEEYNPIRIKSAKVDDAKATIESALSRINADITKVNKKQKTKISLLSLTNEDIRDVANISLQLPVSCIVQALSRFHETYIKKGNGSEVSGLWYEHLLGIFMDTKNSFPELNDSKTTYLLLPGCQCRAFCFVRILYFVYKIVVILYGYIVLSS